MPKYDDIEVQLPGQDGNAFMIMGRVGPKIRQKYGKDAESEYLADAMSGDYDHLLRVTGEYVNIY